ncbi:polyketide cyclase [Rhizobium ruizarguesonis]|uniref:SRPBCC family protein n=1 Tax=Rhizobium ruizarguesonis TaxID=2081791 RepID=UPI00102FDA4E|nr:SRPBCC family protein [Rhizobium ruizarguesonis]TAU00937.1 polyketide cyclase [Rhizobium ruizarguesonis]TAZ20268.1 polyketide cyclase [Rhizobium ruizarguesonis]
MTASTQHELVLVREFDAPREKIYKAWTDPALLKQWFVPRPWGVTEATLDVRPGGSSVVVMHDPEGNQYPNRGVYLEIVENEKIVFTDAYTSAWVPSEKPFFTGVILLEDLGNGLTKYTAKALHWRTEDKEAHEKMGFHEGWGKAADQLAELLAKM